MSMPLLHVLLPMSEALKWVSLVLSVALERVSLALVPLLLFCTVRTLPGAGPARQITDFLKSKLLNHLKLNKYLDV